MIYCLTLISPIFDNNKKITNFLFSEEDITESRNAREKLKKSEHIYQVLIDKADKAFDDKDFPISKSLYNEALVVKPNEQYPKTRITEIDRILADLEKSEKQKAAEDKAYNDLITAADENFNKESWTLAKNLYNNALGVKPQEKYPKDQIAIIDVKLKEIAEDEQAQKIRNDKYAIAINDADKFFKVKEYKDSKEKYEFALTFKPDEEYPQQKIAEINAILDQIEKEKNDALALEKSYNDAITNAFRSIPIEDLKKIQSFLPTINEWMDAGENQYAEDGTCTYDSSYWADRQCSWDILERIDINIFNIIQEEWERDNTSKSLAVFAN